MAEALFNCKGIYSLHFFTLEIVKNIPFPTCISRGALSPGIVTEVLEFLLELNVQAAAPVSLDKAHRQMHHKLSPLCWDQMPVKKLVFPNFIITYLFSDFSDLY
jgi:hypothetical protein